MIARIKYIWFLLKNIKKLIPRIKLEKEYIVGCGSCTLKCRARYVRLQLFVYPAVGILAKDRAVARAKSLGM